MHGPPRTAIDNPDATVAAGVPETALYSQGTVRGNRLPVAVPTGVDARRLPGTPFLDPETADLPDARHATEDEIRQMRSLMASARLPEEGQPFSDMAVTALTDDLALLMPNGAMLSAARPFWAFVWPRDNAINAAALAAVGLVDEAWRLLAFVGSVQESDGQFEARYLPDGSGRTSDARGRQHDGIGFTLWSAAYVLQRTPEEQRSAQLELVRRPLLAAVRAACALIDPDTGLPAVSQDYWEIDLDAPSLGVAAPLLAGLEASDVLLGALEEQEPRHRATQAANQLAGGIRTHFASNGYQRLPEGGGRDASLCFLLPPFRRDAAPFEDARDAWLETTTTMRVANGGVRPGEQWPDPHTAWTPQTALHALTAAANGESALADQLLHWLDAHRTRMGSLPEKVTGEGYPAAVAPISLVASTVLIALAHHDNRDTRLVDTR